MRDLHNPEQGFSDGLPRANGVKGELGRNSPTIWNAAYVDFPFWDGRTASLEEQAGKPITADVEMDQKVPELIQELEAVPEYRERFRKVFGTDAISFTDSPAPSPRSSAPSSPSTPPSTASRRATRAPSRRRRTRAGHFSSGKQRALRAT